MSEINDTEELPEGIFTLNLRVSNQYQRKYHSLKAKYKIWHMKKVSFYGGFITYLIFITCKDKIVISSIIENYVLYWYHTYLLHRGTDRTEAMIHQHFTVLAGENNPKRK